MPAPLGFEMSPLPQPAQSPTPVETYADQQKNQGAQMPPVYYGGKTGSAAYMADKVLSGWLAGTKMAQERKAKKMSDEVGASKTGLDLIGQVYRSAVESGDQKKIDESSRALGEAYNDYLNKAEQYAMPEGDGKKKGIGGKIKEGLKRFAQGGENPHMNIAHSTLEIMRKTDPRELYGPSKADKQQQERASLELENEKKKSKLTDFSIEEQTAIKAARDDYQKAMLSGDKTAQDKAIQGLSIWGVNIQSSAEREVKEQVNQAGLKGIADLQSGKYASIDQLPALERGAMVSLGIAPQTKNAMQAYLEQVGQGKRFKTEYEAAHQYMLDERTSRVMGMKPTPLEELRASQRIILQHELQDPIKAKKAGLKEPLKAGEQPPQWMIEEQAEKRYKESAEEKADTKLYSDIAVNRITKQALNGFSPVEQEEIKKRFLTQDDATGFMVFNGSPNLEGMDPQAAQTLYKSFRSRASNLAKQMYPGLDDETLNERFGMTPPELLPPDQRPPVTLNQRRGGFSGMGMTPSPDGPAKANAPKMSYPPQGKYKLSKGGESANSGMALELTADEAQKAASSGFQLEQVQ